MAETASRESRLSEFLNVMKIAYGSRYFGDGFTALRLAAERHVIHMHMGADGRADAVLHTRPDGKISGIGVLPESAHRGVASALVSRAIDEFSHLFVEVSTENRDMLALISRVGFQPIVDRERLSELLGSDSLKILRSRIIEGMLIYERRTSHPAANPISEFAGFELTSIPRRPIREELRMVGLGDSIVYGRNDWLQGGWVEATRKRLSSTTPGAVVFNLGIGGMRSSDLLPRIVCELPTRRPTVVVIGIGSNDAVRGPSPSDSTAVAPLQFEANVTAAIDRIASMGARPILLEIPPVDEGRTSPLGDHFILNSDIAKLNDSLCRLAGRYHLTLLRVSQAFLETADYRALLDDGLHPNSAGHQVIASLVIDALPASG